jgi:hypothetical protein
MANIRQQSKQHMKVVAGMFAALVWIGLSGRPGWRAVPVAAATGKSLGTKLANVDEPITRFDAVVITKLTVGGQQIDAGRSTGAREISPGTPFQADEDWLKNVSIFVTNRTNKVIVCAEVELLFPDIGDGSVGRPTTGYTISVGQRPEWSLYYRDGTKMLPDATRKPLSLAPGKTLEIPVADYINQIQSVVEEKLPFLQITRVNISRGSFYFEGGMRWEGSSHYYSVPETGHPGYYTKLASNYFPGDPGQYRARE